MPLWSISGHSIFKTDFFHDMCSSCFRVAFFKNNLSSSATFFSSDHCCYSQNTIFSQQSDTTQQLQRHVSCSKSSCNACNTDTMLKMILQIEIISLVFHRFLSSPFLRLYLMSRALPISVRNITPSLEESDGFSGVWSPEAATLMSCGPGTTSNPSQKVVNNYLSYSDVYCILGLFTYRMV